MRRYNYILISLVIVLFSYSCNNDDNDNDNEPTPTITTNNVILGAQKNNSTGGFYSNATMRVYTQEEAYSKQDSIDIVYYFEEEDENTIASPAANINDTIFVGTTAIPNWTVKNETRYYKTSSTTIDFAEIDDENDLISLFNIDDSKRKAKNLLLDDVYAFKTQAEKYGVFRVVSVTGEDTGSIVIEIKIQK